MVISVANVTIRDVTNFLIFVDEVVLYVIDEPFIAMRMDFSKD